MADEWLAWLNGGHIATCLAAGRRAFDAEVVAVEGPAPTYEVRIAFRRGEPSPFTTENMHPD